MRDEALREAGRETTRARWRFALMAVVAILVFDTLAAALSLATGWDYSFRGIGSLAVYAAVGFLAGRRFSIKLAVAVTMLTGVAESTVGWAISWVIGPGRQPGALSRPGLIAGIVIAAALLGALIGFFAGLLGVWVREGDGHERG